jgi:hypothetical protein
MGAKVDARSSVGETALHRASCRGHVAIVRVLLCAGASVDATVDRGYNPLYYAIRYHQLEVARVLIDAGASVSKVKLNIYLAVIPDWVHELVSARTLCRRASMTLIGVHKFHRTQITGANDVNVIRHISKHIWSLRLDNAWIMTTGEATFK